MDPVCDDWADAYYGDLYFESVIDVLSPRLSALEAGLIARLLRADPGERVLDLGCGYGRHHAALAEMGLRVLGLDRNASYLARAKAQILTSGTLARGDIRSLPLRAGSVTAAFSWYASLFMFDDAENARVLKSLAEALRRGGRILVEHGNPVRLDAHPAEYAKRTLPGGVLVEEHSTWDRQRGVDRCTRWLNRPDGSRLVGTAQLRYYTVGEWAPLADAAGLRIVDVTSMADGQDGASGPPGPEAPDLIVVLEKRS